jgi:orotate phosphoribosyltransferase
MLPDGEITAWTHHFRRMGALWESNGSEQFHVETSLGGAHVDKYFNSDVVLCSPDLTARIVRSALAPALAKLESVPNWVIGYAPFGLFLAYAVARAVGARCAYADPAAEYATHFDIEAAASVLVVADDVYSGQSVIKTVEAVERRGGRVASFVFCLANMSGEERLGDREIVAATALGAKRYPAEECPMCAQGSQPLLARPNWRTLTARVPTSR